MPRPNPSYSFRTTVTTKIPKSKKARNPLNQPALNHLLITATKPQYSNSTHYPRIFSRGIQSLAKCPLVIRTREEALVLEGVGDFLARLIEKAALKGREEEEEKEEEEGSVGGGGGGGGSALVSGVAAAASTATSSFSATTTTTQTTTSTKPKSKSKSKSKKTTKSKSSSSSSPLSRSSSLSSTTSTTSTSTTQTTTPTHPSSSSHPPLTPTTISTYNSWSLILLVDNREHKASHFQAKLIMSGIQCEQRSLPIGDMLWIARGVKTTKSSNSTTNRKEVEKEKEGEEEVVEVVLGTIIERKTLSDLASSICDLRYMEQRLRLSSASSLLSTNSSSSSSSSSSTSINSKPLSKIIYLLESTPSFSSLDTSSTTQNKTSLTPKMLQMALIRTQVELKFAIQQTKNLDDTIRFCKRLHKRLLRMFFPNEFVLMEEKEEQHCGNIVKDGEEGRRIMPTFTSPTATKRRNQHTSSKDDDDLLNMTFSSPPILPPHTYSSSSCSTYTSYTQFKALISNARHLGTRSVSSIHCAMMKQISGMSERKVKALCKIYDTPCSLMQKVEDDDDDGCLGDIKTNGKERIRNCTIGPKCAQEIEIVYRVDSKGIMKDKKRKRRRRLSVVDEEIEKEEDENGEKRQRRTEEEEVVVEHGGGIHQKNNADADAIVGNDEKNKNDANNDNTPKRRNYGAALTTHTTECSISNVNFRNTTATLESLITKSTTAATITDTYKSTSSSSSYSNEGKRINKGKNDMYNNTTASTTNNNDKYCNKKTKRNNPCTTPSKLDDDDNDGTKKQKSMTFSTNNTTTASSLSATTTTTTSRGAMSIPLEVVDIIESSEDENNVTEEEEEDDNNNNYKENEKRTPNSIRSNTIVMNQAKNNHSIQGNNNTQKEDAKMKSGYTYTDDDNDNDDDDKLKESAMKLTKKNQTEVETSFDSLQNNSDDEEEEEEKEEPFSYDLTQHDDDNDNNNNNNIDDDDDVNDKDSNVYVDDKDKSCKTSLEQMSNDLNQNKIDNDEQNKRQIMKNTTEDFCFDLTQDSLDDDDDDDYDNDDTNSKDIDKEIKKVVSDSKEISVTSHQNDDSNHNDDDDDDESSSRENSSTHGDCSRKKDACEVNDELSSSSHNGSSSDGDQKQGIDGGDNDHQQHYHACDCKNDVDSCDNCDDKSVENEHDYQHIVIFSSQSQDKGEEEEEDNKNSDDDDNNNKEEEKKEESALEVMRGNTNIEGCKKHKKVVIYSIESQSQGEETDEEESAERLVSRNVSAGGKHPILDTEGIDGNIAQKNSHGSNNIRKEWKTKLCMEENITKTGEEEAEEDAESIFSSAKHCNRFSFLRDDTMDSNDEHSDAMNEKNDDIEIIEID